VAHLTVSAAQGIQVSWNLVAITIPAVPIGGHVAAIVAGLLPFIGRLSAYRASVGMALWD